MSDTNRQEPTKPTTPASQRRHTWIKKVRSRSKRRAFRHKIRLYMLGKYEFR